MSDPAPPVGQPFTPDDRPPVSTPAQANASLRHQVGVTLQRLIPTILGVVEQRDCTRPETYAVVRSSILDALNGARREVERYIDAYIITEDPDGIRQIVFQVNDQRGMVMDSPADGQEDTSGKETP
jgi:hypothetical protein